MTIPLFIPPGQSIQRMQRAYRTFTDNHGRKFVATVDIRNGAPCEELKPKDFNPPWLPSMGYAKFRADHDIEFRWDYGTLATELAGLTAEVYSVYRKFAMREKLPVPEVGGYVDPLVVDGSGEGPPPLSPAIPLACEQGDPWILGVPGAQVNPYLKEILEQGVGSSSKEALDYIRGKLAQTAKDMRIELVPTKELPVDLTKAEKPRRVDDPAPLAEMPDITYQQFLQECRGRKMSMPDIYKAWTDHKALMAANPTAGAAV